MINVITNITASIPHKKILRNHNGKSQIVVYSESIIYDLYTGTHTCLATTK